MKKTKNNTISSILGIYIFLVYCVYPLYVDDGYYNIGLAKIKFLYTLSILTFFAVLLIKIMQLIRNNKNGLALYHWNKISITEKLLYAYMTIITVSYLTSPFKKDILWGSEDWYLGTIPLLLMSSFIIFLIHDWKEQKWVGYGCLIISGLVFSLGICHRFSFYPIRIEPTKYSEFISTLGNINWFCGYMSVISPIGIGMFVLKERDKYKSKWQEYLLSAYVLISFIAGFCQGSNSFFLWVTALFLVLLWIAIKNTGRLKKYMLTVGMFGMAGQLVRIIYYLFPGKYNYDINILNNTIDTNATLIIAIIGFFLYFIIKEGKEISVTHQKIFQNILIGTISVCILLYVILSIYNTKTGIPYLSNHSIFLWDEYWGNGRGGIYQESISLFNKMNFLQKMIGVGADGFFAFCYSFPDTVTNLNHNFNGIRVTNAHCEILTNLINLGILGTVTYIGMLFTFFIRCMKYGAQKPMLYIASLCTICYFSNNLIGFAQVLNLPFLFIVIGLGEYYMRK